ncbi:MAG: hypothetical protein M3Q70_03055 [bacterium]|nr:hypothetical protein [bacterium]
MPDFTETAAERRINDAPATKNNSSDQSDLNMGSPEIPASHSEYDIEPSKLSSQGLIKACGYYAKLAEINPDLAHTQAEATVKIIQQSESLKKEGLDEAKIKKAQWGTMGDRHKKRVKEKEDLAPDLPVKISSPETPNDIPGTDKNTDSGQEIDAKHPVVYNMPPISIRADPNIKATQPEVLIDAPTLANAAKSVKSHLQPKPEVHQEPTGNEAVKLDVDYQEDIFTQNNPDNASVLLLEPDTNITNEIASENNKVPPAETKTRTMPVMKFYAADKTSAFNTEIDQINDNDGAGLLESAAESEDLITESDISPALESAPDGADLTATNIDPLDAETFSIESSEAVQLEPNTEVVDSFNTALQNYIFNNDIDKELPPEDDGSLNLTYAEEVMNEVNQPIPNIVHEFSNSLSELSNEDKIILSPTLQEIADVVQTLDYLKTEEVDPELTKVAEQELRELVIILLEALDLNHDNENVEALITTLLKVKNLKQPRPDIVNFSTSYIENQGTYELKKQSSPLVNLLTNIEQNAARLLGRFVLFSAARFPLEISTA